MNHHYAKHFLLQNAEASLKNKLLGSVRNFAALAEKFIILCGCKDGGLDPLWKAEVYGQAFQPLLRCITCWKAAIGLMVLSLQTSRPDLLYLNYEKWKGKSLGILFTPDNLPNTRSTKAVVMSSVNLKVMPISGLIT